MTYKQYFEEKIIDINVRMAAERNCITQRGNDTYTQQNNVVGKYNLLPSAFSWHRTPEGFEFWSWFNSTLK